LRLKALGVGAIYFNPIFRARSNHKYDTADYLAIDRRSVMKAFRALCEDAKARGIASYWTACFRIPARFSR
jgi:glycosidase